MIKPAISVVIPVYNGEKYLRQCVESLLNQTSRPYEVIIVDDGSTDQTPSIVESFGDSIVRLRQNQDGPATARNFGVEAASGEYLAFIDADDIWMPGKLALQIGYFTDHPETGIVFGMMKNFYSPETDAEFRSRYACAEKIVPGIHAGTMLLKKETFLRVGLFNSSLKMGEFIDWQARATALKCAVHVLPELLMLRRIHPSNYGITNKCHRQDYLSIVRGILEKKKGVQIHDQS
jgi:glycosyltransferase involved in cell wall biosynthesis